jgi:peptide/nickel transport system ATP-binding protein/oligopeptide transport system ATP-binding protein
MSALLEVRGLKKYFPIRGGLLRRVVANVKAVDDVSFSIKRGRTLGLVGESGCGKSTLGRAVLRLHEPTAGEVILDGRPITGISHRELKQRRREMQIIFQDPYASLNPRRTILQTLREPLDLHRIGTPAQRRSRVQELLELVGLRPESLSRYPHEFSGGQRQRIGVARALALDPKLVIADEAVSALDVSVQAQVLNLISDLQEQLGLSFLFISHDLAVVQHVSHDVAVMYLGKIVESGPADEVYGDPKHPYTRALLTAVPVPDPKCHREHIVLSGDVPSPANPPPGCPFHTRCPEVMPQCKEVRPKTVTIGAADSTHRTVCHLYG